ncbi:MAG: hypothetical protein H7Z14_10870 [Anaerolineae bacterium]|nr:hypothetical protein [Phycisphaerae bacterium]
MSDTTISLTSGPMRLDFARDHHGEFGFQLLIATGDGWRPISAPGNVLVRGSSFNLRPTDVTLIDPTWIAFRGRTPRYKFAGTVRTDLQPGWFCFDIEIDAPDPVTLKMSDGYEPEIMLDLGALPPYERGDHVWFMTNVANPTKWNDDAYGNDMPATYLFDAYLKSEVMMFFDMTAMSWMSMQNTGRFLNYRCGFKRLYQPKPAGSVGLYLDGFCGKTFPAGKSRFVYYINAAPRMQTPTDQEAVQLLVNRCLPLLPKTSDWPARATSWTEFAHKCAIDLSNTEHCWGHNETGEFILNYVDAHSPAWKEAIEARGNKFDMMQPCLESGVWSAHPLSIVCATSPDPVYERLQSRLLRFIDRMVLAEKSPLAPAVDDTPRGTWQHVYVTEQLFQVARLNQNEPLMRRARHEADTVIIPLARKLQYLLPLSFGKQSLIKCGSGDAHSLLGTYASFMLDLHDWTGEQSYLEEAARALRVNHGLPVNAVHQEIFMLAMGVHAAARMAEMTGNAEFIEICRYLLAQTLRMLHWFNDQTSDESRAINTLGMFQACATISYPAIFENIETLARIAPALKTVGADESLLRVFDHARKNNFYFFPHCLPEHEKFPLQFVPLENIGILEGPPASSVGAEIYGAGWVFRAYLLWEALARCENRDIMVLSLDVFDERRQMEAGSLNLTFIAFNGTDDAIQSQIVIPLAATSDATIAIGDAAPVESLGDRLQIRLLPGEIKWIRLHVPRWTANVEMLAALRD